MKRIVFVLLIAGLINNVNAQQGFQSYADGAPATIIKKVDVEGTEMLYEKWLPTTIKSTN